MAIGDRVEEALAKLALQDYENAMVQTAIAIDGTAKRKYGSKLRTGERFRKFVRENEEFIIYVGLGCGPRLIFVGDGAGMKLAHRGSLSEVVYKYVRNALLHEGDVSGDIVFRQGPVLGNENGRFIVSSELIVGLLLSVVADPVNDSQKLRRDVSIGLAGRTLSVNSCWGQIVQVRGILGFP